MQNLKIRQQHIRQSALELQLAILAKAAELHDAALSGQTSDSSRVLKIARYLARAAGPSGCRAEYEA
ncbi:MAG TPA: hypothetical protein VN932_00415 [Rhizomicrobium sp.]|nr:hypothetical protein [Rhizomicrobium sp.]